MRVTIELDLSGNEFLTLLRKVPKTVAQQLFNATTASPLASIEEKDLLGKSAQELIDSKKR